MKRSYLHNILIFHYVITENREKKRVCVCVQNSLSDVLKLKPGDYSVIRIRLQDGLDISNLILIIVFKARKCGIEVCKMTVSISRERLLTSHSLLSIYSPRKAVL